MKTAELIKLLRKNGWVFHKHGGRHDLYCHPEHSNKIPIQRSKSEVPTGTVQKILKDAGIK